MAEGGQLEPLIITEDGDITEGLPEKRVVSSLTVILRSSKVESALKKEEGHTCKGKNEENPESKLCLREQQATTEGDQRGERVVDEEDKADTSEETATINDGQDRVAGGSEAQMTVRMRIHEKPEKTKDTDKETATPTDLRVDINGHDSSDQPPKGTEIQQEDQEKVCGLLFISIWLPCTLSKSCV